MMCYRYPRGFHSLSRLSIVETSGVLQFFSIAYTLILALCPHRWKPAANVSTTKNSSAKLFTETVLLNALFAQLQAGFLMIQHNFHNQALFVHMENSGLQIANSNHQLVSLRQHLLKLNGQNFHSSVNALMKPKVTSSVICTSTQCSVGRVYC